MEQTRCVDNIECPYCHKKFDGYEATNYDSSCESVECPSCGKTMRILQSVEFLAEVVDW